MKTFEDLEFNVHPNSLFGFNGQAKMDFDNGYGVSVITGEYAYTSELEPYEIAILHDGIITYDTHISDDVIGYCTQEKVTEIMKQVQELKK